MSEINTQKIDLSSEEDIFDMNGSEFLNENLEPEQIASVITDITGTPAVDSEEYSAKKLSKKQLFIKLRMKRKEDAKKIKIKKEKEEEEVNESSDDDTPGFFTTPPDDIPTDPIKKKTHQARKFVQREDFLIESVKHHYDPNNLNENYNLTPTQVKSLDVQKFGEFEFKNGVINKTSKKQTSLAVNKRKYKNVFMQDNLEAFPGLPEPKINDSDILNNIIIMNQNNEQKMELTSEEVEFINQPLNASLESDTSITNDMNDYVTMNENSETNDVSITTTILIMNSSNEQKIETPSVEEVAINQPQIEVTQTSEIETPVVSEPQIEVTQTSEIEIPVISDKKEIPVISDNIQIQKLEENVNLIINNMNMREEYYSYLRTCTNEQFDIELSIIDKIKMEKVLTTFTAPKIDEQKPINTGCIPKQPKIKETVENDKDWKTVDNKKKKVSKPKEVTNFSDDSWVKSRRMPNRSLSDLAIRPNKQANVGKRPVNTVPVTTSFAKTLKKDLAPSNAEVVVNAPIEKEVTVTQVIGSPPIKKAEENKKVVNTKFVKSNTDIHFYVPKPQAVMPVPKGVPITVWIRIEQDANKLPEEERPNFINRRLNNFFARRVRGHLTVLRERWTTNAKRLKIKEKNIWLNDYKSIEAAIVKNTIENKQVVFTTWLSNARSFIKGDMPIDWYELVKSQ